VAGLQRQLALSVAERQELAARLAGRDVEAAASAEVRTPGKGRWAFLCCFRPKQAPLPSLSAHTRIAVCCALPQAGFLDVEAAGAARELSVRQYLDAQLAGLLGLSDPRDRLMALAREVRRAGRSGGWVWAGGRVGLLRRHGWTPVSHRGRGCLMLTHLPLGLVLSFFVASFNPHLLGRVRQVCALKQSESQLQAALAAARHREDAARQRLAAQGAALRAAQEAAAEAQVPLRGEQAAAGRARQAWAVAGAAGVERSGLAWSVLASAGVALRAGMGVVLS
jgi:hypothetical protein